MTVLFDWRTVERAPLFARFPEEAAGWSAWQALVGQLSELRFSAAPSDVQSAVQREWVTATIAGVHERFFAAVDALTSRMAAPPRRRCVFISHRSTDVAKAERVACLADERGWDVWLDVLDPHLAWANRLPAGPLKSLLIAAIIEIGLLNATHVIALLTPASRRSRWIPYEFGRAKSRQLSSFQCASYVDAAVAAPEYTLLGMTLASEPDICGWLGAVVAPSPCSSLPSPF